MRNKILKYREFSLNESNDTPETYIKCKLMELKRAIDKLFDDERIEEPENISLDKAKENSKLKKSSLSLSDQGVTLDSSEISLYSQTDDSLTIKYTDQDGVYNLFISINIKDGIPSDQNGDFSTDDINKIFVKFKKYNIDNIDLIGQTTYNFTVEKKNNEFRFSNGDNKDMSTLEFLEFLKSDFEDKYGENNLEIETN